MKNVFSLLFVATLLIVTTGIETRADLARPNPTEKKGKVVYHSYLEIVPDAKANVARLQIDPESLKALRDALNELPKEGSASGAISQSSTRTILAGISLFAALSFGGVWLMRAGSSRGQKAMAAVLIGTAMLGAAAIVTRGNAGPPPRYQWRNLSQNLGNGRTTSGDIQIEVMQEGRGISLVIPVQPPVNTDKPKTDD
jgi:hypothetical protein